MKINILLQFLSLSFIHKLLKIQSALFISVSFLLYVSLVKMKSIPHDIHVFYFEMFQDVPHSKNKVISMLVYSCLLHAVCKLD